MITTDGDGGPIAIGIVGVTCVAAAVTGVAISVVSAAVIVTTTTTAITALSFSTVAFSVPFAMHLSRYGRLPSWNKSRTQCLVIFHSIVKKILAMAICCKFLLCYFKYCFHL